MTKIAIYVEGGGPTAQTQSELRNGFDILLSQQKQAAREKRLGWKLVPCGGRDEAYNAFIHEITQSAAETLVVLLVDSENELDPEGEKKRGLTDAQTRKNHLVERDKWNLNEIPPERIHLMVQCMEAWIVADPDALAGYYGSGFNIQKLPKSPNLENEEKLQVYAKLENATKQTKKGAYQKVKHASKLLQEIDPTKVAARCPRFKTFTTWLADQIKNA